MRTISSSDARADLDHLLDQFRSDGGPVQIEYASGRAVLVSEEDWEAIQETLFLLALPGMRESIRAGLAEPIEEASPDAGWS